jgi:hypothetical protein
MAVTHTQTMIAQLVRRHLQVAGQLMLAPPNLEAEMRRGCRELAEQVRRDPALRPLVEETFNLTFTAGAAPIPTTKELLRTSLPGARLTVTGITDPFSWYARRKDMERGRVTLPRWTQEGSSVIVRTATAVADGTTGTLQACFVPVVGATVGATTLDDQLVQPLVSLLAEWWGGMRNGSTETSSA